MTKKERKELKRKIHKTTRKTARKRFLKEDLDNHEKED